MKRTFLEEWAAFDSGECQTKQKRLYFFLDGTGKAGKYNLGGRMMFNIAYGDLASRYQKLEEKILCWLKNKIGIILGTVVGGYYLSAYAGR